MRPYTAFIPASVSDADITGLRPSVQVLVDLVDPDEPAWPAIAGVLREMRMADIELDRATIVAAVKLGRRRWDDVVKAAHQANTGPRRQASLALAANAIVYYIRRGSLIKIGTTTDPVHRFSDLMPEEILAFEPGSYPTEGQRHRQFAHLRCRGEYFRAEPELTDHIRRVRQLYGDPDPSWPMLKRGTGRPVPLPEGETMCAPEASSALGIRMNTLRGWAHRKKLTPAGKDDRGRLLYYVNQLVHLRDNPRAQTRREAA